MPHIGKNLWNYSKIYEYTCHIIIHVHITLQYIYYVSFLSYCVPLSLWALYIIRAPSPKFHYWNNYFKIPNLYVQCFLIPSVSPLKPMNISKVRYIFLCYRSKWPVISNKQSRKSVSVHAVFKCLVVQSLKRLILHPCLNKLKRF